MLKKIYLFVLGMVLWAVNDSLAETKVWSDVAELSYVNTSGNTKVQNFLVNNAFKYLFSPNITGTWNFNALNGQTDDVRTAERYSTEFRGDYKLSERYYAFGNAIWLKDQFAGIDARYYLGAGVGYFLIKVPKHTLLTEAGLNYTKDNFTDGTSRDYMGGRLFGKYSYAFTEKNIFSQSVEYIPGFKEQTNYFVNSETALVSALNGFLSLKTSYVVKYSNEPPAGKKNTDSITSATLVVNF